MSRRRVLLAAGIAAGCGLLLIAIGRSLPRANGGTALLSSGEPVAVKRKPAGGFLAFARTPRRPGNLLMRVGVAGRSAAGRPIRLRQLGDPAIGSPVLVFGCIHGDECAASRLMPVTGGCPDPSADLYLVPSLNPDGAALGTRLNGRGVDLNRNFPSGWRPIGRAGDPQHSGPRPLSEPETRLAARIVRRLRPEVTIWFHQHYARRPLVRAWGGSVAAASKFARLAKLPFRRLPWLAGTAPNWQNHRFPGTSSFVVELPRGSLANDLKARLERAIVSLGRKVGED
jgi:protein MpaA